MLIQFLKNCFVLIFGIKNFIKVKQLIYQKKGKIDESIILLNIFIDKNKKGTMIDVGAHFGESFNPYLLLGWKVYAFEPDPFNYSKIPYKNKNLKLSQIAISNREEADVYFYRSEESTGISSLSPFRDSHKVSNTTNVTTLRKIVDLEKIEFVDYLKIDTEGHDLFVLEGFPWEKFYPSIIICEFEDSKTIPLGYDYEKLGDFLLSKGYFVYLSEWEPVVHYGKNQTWKECRKYPGKLTNVNAWGNFICFKDENDSKKFFQMICKKN